MKKQNYSHNKADAKKNHKRDEAEARQAHYDSLTYKEKIAQIAARRGLSKREHDRLNKLNKNH